MTSTRTVKIGEKTVTIENVPDYITDEELKRFAFMKIFQLEVGKTLGRIGSAS